MRYQDKRGWLFEASQGNKHVMWSIYCFNPKKKIWWAWPCANWYTTKEQAEKALARFTEKLGWQEAV